MRVDDTPHLGALCLRAEAAISGLNDAPEAPARVATARRQAAAATVRLDASPLDDATAGAVDGRRAAGAPPVEALGASGATAIGGWTSALRLDGMATQDIAALEYANALDALAAVDGLAVDAGRDLIGVLRSCHELMVRGLVDPAETGRWRRTAQDVHDGAEGRVVYRTPAPEAVPELVDQLAADVAAAGRDAHPVVVASVVHGRLLAIAPFDAANGRVARLVLRVLLAAAGRTGAHQAAWEVHHAASTGSYHAEVAASLRRRGDWTLWAERDLEGVVAVLEQTARDAGVGPAHVLLGDRARDLAATLAPGATVTVNEHATATGVSRARARGDLDALAAAGLLATEGRTRGLRAVRTDLALGASGGSPTR